MIASPERSGKPLRIVHAASFGYKPVKAWLHNVATKLSNGFIRNGHHVTNFSVRDIARWAGPLGSRAIGKAQARRALLDYCYGFEPDLLVLGHADLIDVATIARLRDKLPELKVIQWNVDWLAQPGEAVSGDNTAVANWSKLLSKDEVVDVTFVTTGGAKLRRLNDQMIGEVAWLPNPVDPSVETARVFEQARPPHDVFFASSSEDRRRFHIGDWHDMGQFAERLSERLPQARLLTLGIGGSGSLFGPRLQDAFASSAIGLNISRRNDFYLYSSDRIGQMAGNGMVVCIDRASGFDDLFSDDEMVFYSSEDELFGRIETLVADPGRRQRMGAASWSRFQEWFGNEVLAAYMIDVAFNRHDPANYAWPTMAEVHPDR